MKKDKEKLPVWDEKDFAQISGFAGSAVLTFPDNLDTALSIIKRGCGKRSVIEHLLKVFEREAEILLQEGFPLFGEHEKKKPRDDASLLKRINWDTEHLRQGVKLNSSLRVLERARRVRDSILRNDAEQAAINMMRLTFAAVTANLFDLVIRGIRAKTAPSKGGRAAKKEPSFALLVQYAWEKSKKKTCLSMWKFLQRKLQAGDVTISDCDFVYEEETNRITLYFRNGKSRDIGFRSFQRYVKDFKEGLKKNSQ